MTSFACNAFKTLVRAKVIVRRRSGSVAAETPLSLFGPEWTSQGLFEAGRRRMEMSGRKVETLECSVVAETTFKQIPVHLVDVGLTNDSLTESQKKRPRDRGMSVTDRFENHVSVSHNLINVGSLPEA